LLLLAACAGSVNVLSIVRLGGALSGIVTGDVVTTGAALGEDRWVLLRYPAVAICAFGLGVAVWSVGLRWLALTSADGHRIGLWAELVLLLCLPVGLAATHGRPGEATSMTLLATAAVAMGAQSAICLRDGVSTTYMTGAITTAVHDLVTGGPRRDAVGNLTRGLALFVGAVATASLITVDAWVAATFPALLVAMAIGARRRTDRHLHDRLLRPG
jgi:uncharacterized membrane protein YoaK (UPF0700 family)